MAEKKDIVIIGGGPGGYLAALRAAQLRKSVVLIEEDRVGGTCMNYGCIPTKYLLHQSRLFRELKVNRNLQGPVAEIGCNWTKVQEGRASVVERLVSGIEFLLRKGKVEIIKAKGGLREGRSVVAGGPQEERVFEAGAVILATGSRAASLPFLKPDGRLVVTSREALEFADIPKKLLVIGAGAIGLEIGSIYQRLGSDVTVLEILPQILPGSDKEAAARLERALKKQGLKIFTQMRIDEAVREEGRVILKGVGLRNNVPFAHEGEKVLLAAGRRPNSESFSEEPASVAVDRGFVAVNDRLETNRKRVYAIGDLIGGKLLAHKAYHDALVAVDNVDGKDRSVDYRALPTAVFTDPEFASVGLSEEEAVEKGIKIQAGVFPLQASGRALTMDATDGMVKVVADGDDTVVGAHIISPAASEMIPELTLAVFKGLKIKDLADAIYIHPTISEAIGDAALKARNEALHILNQ